jgi:hypothetical protein
MAVEFFERVKAEFIPKVVSATVPFFHLKTGLIRLKRTEEGPEG